MPKKRNLKAPNDSELTDISALFDLASRGLDSWAGDDDFLVNMGSMSPEDIDEEGSEGRQELLEIIGLAKLPQVPGDDLEIEADDLQVILPAVVEVLGNFSIPGLDGKAPKRFEEAQNAAFAQVSLNTPSQEIEEKVNLHLKKLGLN
jgi:hypothetical protein